MQFNIIGGAMAQWKIVALTLWLAIVCFGSPLRAQSAPDKITLGTITLQ